MRFFASVMLVLAISAGAADADQIPDPTADVNVAHPAFAPGSGPLMGIDSAHHNFHTIDNRYKPFADLMRSDGFQLLDSKAPFTSENLTPLKILVVSNALPTALADPDNWMRPASSAFTPAEIAAVKTWVAGGGSLLLIADHKPMATSAHDLAAAFGFDLDDGVVERDPMVSSFPDLFTRAAGTLADDAVTRGRNAGEMVTSVETFTGSAFHAPATARPIIVLSKGYMSHQCILPCPVGVPEHSVAGFLQGAVMHFGKGRVAMFGEAAMFTAQEVTGHNPPLHFGFTAPTAKQNKQFILNLVNWLAGALDD